MPTYQYACTECGKPLEVVQTFTDDPLTECPACHGRLRKVFNSVGIVFKGSGFYRTDSRAGSKEATPSADAAASSSTSPVSPSTTADSSPAPAASSSSGRDSSSGSSASTTSTTSTTKAASA